MTIVALGLISAQRTNRDELELSKPDERSRQERPRTLAHLRVDGAPILLPQSEEPNRGGPRGNDPAGLFSPRYSQLNGGPTIPGPDSNLRVVICVIRR
jgi:hypothetical protein